MGGREGGIGRNEGGGEGGEGKGKRGGKGEKKEGEGNREEGWKGTGSAARRKQEVQGEGNRKGKQLERGASWHCRCPCPYAAVYWSPLLLGIRVFLCVCSCVFGCVCVSGLFVCFYMYTDGDALAVFNHADVFLGGWFIRLGCLNCVCVCAMTCGLW